MDSVVHLSLRFSIHNCCASPHWFVVKFTKFTRRQKSFLQPRLSSHLCQPYAWFPIIGLLRAIPQFNCPPFYWSGSRKLTDEFYKPANQLSPSLTKRHIPDSDTLNFSTYISPYHDASTPEIFFNLPRLPTWNCTAPVISSSFHLAYIIENHDLHTIPKPILPISQRRAWCWL